MKSGCLVRTFESTDEKVSFFSGCGNEDQVVSSLIRGKDDAGFKTYLNLKRA